MSSQWLQRIAICPRRAKDGHAMLWINPHTSFYFRAQLGMTSDEGLNAYGAATWGQPFLYQGFNEHLGWMHTTSSADSTDEFAETVTQKDGKYVYKYGNEERPVTVKNITINYKAANGSMAKKTFTTYYPSRPDRARGRRQMDRHVDHEHADRGAGTILRPHQGQELRRDMKVAASAPIPPTTRFMPTTLAIRLQAPPAQGPPARDLWLCASGRDTTGPNAASARSVSTASRRYARTVRACAKLSFSIAAASPMRSCMPPDARRIRCPIFWIGTAASGYRAAAIRLSSQSRYSIEAISPTTVMASAIPFTARVSASRMIVASVVKRTAS